MRTALASVVIAPALAFALALFALPGCTKKKSPEAKAECEALLDAISSSAGAMRGAAGGSHDVYADRFERSLQMVTAVNVTDARLKKMQDDYEEILRKAITAARDKSMNDHDFMAWLETLRVQEQGRVGQMQSYCSKP